MKVPPTAHVPVEWPVHEELRGACPKCSSKEPGGFVGRVYLSRCVNCGWAGPTHLATAEEAKRDGTRLTHHGMAI